MIEILRDQVGVIKDQDIVPTDDVYPQFPAAPMSEAEREEYYDMLCDAEDARQAIEDARNADIEDIRKNRSFRARNIALKEAVTALASSKRSAGAAYVHRIGRDTSKIRGAENAQDRQPVEVAQAFELGEAACRLCPLSDYCDLFQEGTLMAHLDTDSTAPDAVRRAKSNREKLRSRVKANAYDSNNHLCATNMQSGRLSADIP